MVVGNQVNESIHSTTVISLSLAFNQLNAYQVIECKIHIWQMFGGDFQFEFKWIKKIIREFINDSDYYMANSSIVFQYEVIKSLDYSNIVGVNAAN